MSKENVEEIKLHFEDALNKILYIVFISVHTYIQEILRGQVKTDLMRAIPHTRKASLQPETSTLGC